MIELLYIGRACSDSEVAISSLFRGGEVEYTGTIFIYFS